MKKQQHLDSPGVRCKVQSLQRKGSSHTTDLVDPGPLSNPCSIYDVTLPLQFTLVTVEHPHACYMLGKC